MKMQIKNINAILLLTAAVMLSSCQEVIELDLNSAAPQIVVEGGISDQPGPDTIKLTRTVNFSDKNAFPEVSHAIVKLTDNLGNTETLTEVNPGKYITNTLEGTPGRTYTLLISADGKDYTSVSTMPAHTGLDSLTVQEFFGTPLVVAHFTDPIGIENFYSLRVKWNDTLLPGRDFIVDDRLQDGHPVEQPLFFFDDDNPGRGLQIGDSVEVILESIDRHVYEHFRTLGLAQGGNQAASPANPISNITNGGLGYFSAHTRSRLTIVIR
jgi:hypothetical protein